MKVKTQISLEPCANSQGRSENGVETFNAGARPARTGVARLIKVKRGERAEAADAKTGAFAYYERLIRSKDLFSLSTACMSTVEGTLIGPGSWRKDFV